ncbi:MAG: hypothetical protein Q4B22_07445 [Eubacteriales bacterium]|nr:hypothetical protein [Eubacteriales bacterium]
MWKTIMGKLLKCFGKKPQTAVINDPAADAEKKLGQPVSVLRECDLWKENASYCTTGQFRDLGTKGFKRHCGPTAVTNAVRAIRSRYGYGDRGMQPEEDFLKVARIGTRSLIYHNTDLLHRFGGTYDSLSGIFVRLCFWRFGIPRTVKIRQKVAFTKDFWIRSLEKGSLLYLHLLRHSCYSSHHVICYGYAEVESEDHLYKKLYLKIADGWIRQPRYLDADDIRFCHYLEVRQKGN